MPQDQKKPKKHVKIIGSYLSPYVRKVLVVLDIKGISYEIDPIIAFMGSDEFTTISPVRRIPVLIDGDVTVSDSTIVCEYLDDRYPSPSIYPATPAQRARARWLEEYADTRMQEVLMVHFFNNQVLNPVLWNEAPDNTMLEHAKDNEIPHVLTYLEGELPADGFIFGELSIADISIASFFRNQQFIGFEVDADRWPKTAAFVHRVLSLDSFKKLHPFEQAIATAAPIEHREALRAAGCHLTETTLGTGTPRRGWMVFK